MGDEVQSETIEPVETPEVAEPETSVEDQALAAMDDGIDAASDPVREPIAEPEAPAEPVIEPIPGTEAAKPEVPEPDKETETEIKTLGLKTKAAERFRSLTGEVKSFAPIKAELEKAGITDATAFVEQLPRMVQQSKDYVDLIGMVQDTKATPEQYGYTLDYLKDANAAIGGDLAAAQRAFDKASGEVAAWAQLLGKEVPGVYDPLSTHTDLQQEVAAGDITRDRALELARQRTELAVNQTTRQHQNDATQHDTEVRNGTQALNQLGATLAGADPDYARKQPFLMPTLRVITQTMPPSQWVAATQQAYAQIPAMPVAAVAPKPTPGPVRPGPVGRNLHQITNDPLEAMNAGIAAFNAR